MHLVLIPFLVVAAGVFAVLIMSPAAAVTYKLDKHGVSSDTKTLAFGGLSVATLFLVLLIAM